MNSLTDLPAAEKLQDGELAAVSANGPNAGPSPFMTLGVANSAVTQFCHNCSLVGSPSPMSKLVRDLTLTSAASLNIANMIGTGVFLKARVMICNIDSPVAVLVVWLTAVALALAGALCYAE